MDAAGMDYSPPQVFSTNGDLICRILKYNRLKFAPPPRVRSNEEGSGQITRVFGELNFPSVMNLEYGYRVRYVLCCGLFLDPLITLTTRKLYAFIILLFCRKCSFTFQIQTLEFVMCFLARTSISDGTPEAGGGQAKENRYYPSRKSRNQKSPRK